MTIKEKLAKEFEAAIVAIFGSMADIDITNESLKEHISSDDIEAIAEKVNFYLDLK